MRSPTIAQGILGGLKSIIGGQIGAYLLVRINVNLLRAFVVLIGTVLGIGLILRAY